MGSRIAGSRETSCGTPGSLDIIGLPTSLSKYLPGLSYMRVARRKSPSVECKVRRVRRSAQRNICIIIPGISPVYENEYHPPLKARLLSCSRWTRSVLVACPHCMYPRKFPVGLCWKKRCHVAPDFIKPLGSFIHFRSGTK